MICRNCQKKFYVKRGFLSLFENKTYYICDACRRAYPIDPIVEHVPLEHHPLICISLFPRFFRLNLWAYSAELSYLVNSLQQNHQDYFLVYTDTFRWTDWHMEALSFLADCEDKPILFICAFLKK